MLIVYICTSASFLSFKRLTVNGDSDEGVLISTPDGIFLNRNASDYPYKSHGQWARAAYAIAGCVLLATFNGWRSFLSPFSHADFLAAYMAILIFVILVVLYHLKDEPEWMPGNTEDSRRRDNVVLPDGGGDGVLLGNFVIMSALVRNSLRRSFSFS
jgi:amino acid transporter